MTNREQAIKQVAEASGDSPNFIASILRVKDWISTRLAREIRYAVDTTERVLELEDALKLLLETHCCDSGEADYEPEWDGDHTVCVDCKSAWHLLQPKGD